MDLAERTNLISPSPTLAIDTKAKQMKAEGQDVCSFGAGEPDFDTPDHIKQAAIDALNNNQTRYTPSSGIPELREAIAKKLFQENHIEYKPTQIIVSTGAKQSCVNAMLAVCQPGDEVVIPAPYWVSYPEMARIAGADPVIIQTRQENGWKMTADEFRDAMTPRTKMVVLNSPNNPTGALYSREELEAIVEVADEEGICILADEMYEKLVYDDAEFVSIASLSKQAYDLTVTVNGFSKAYAMTGWRMGYLGAPEAIAKAIDSIQSHMTSNPTSFAQYGALAALTGDQQCVSDMRDEFNVRRDYVFDRISKMPNVTAVKPMGAFYILMNIERTALSSTNFSDRLLSKQKVAVVPGIAFGNDKTVRISYATSLDVIKKGLDRIEEFLRTV